MGQMFKRGDSHDYGNMGYRVFKRGIHNWIDFRPKINIFKEIIVFCKLRGVMSKKSKNCSFKVKFSCQNQRIFSDFF